MTSPPEVLASGVGTSKTEKLQEICMRTACNDAHMGVLQGHGGPFGAMVCCAGRTISVAHNTVLEDNDPTCHAEMNAIRYACERLGTNDLSSCELFTTCEPCPMCLGFLRRSRSIRQRPNLTVE